MHQPQRNIGEMLSGGYRYGFNGMESDEEVHNSQGTSYDFGALIYDTSVWRWLSGDPLESQYPDISTYSFVNITREEQNLQSGTLLVHDLLMDDNLISIVKNSVGNHTKYNTVDGTTGGNGADVTVQWDPNATPDNIVSKPDGYLTTEAAPTYIGLAHELIHAQHESNGDIIPDSKTVTYSYQKAPERTNSQGEYRPAYMDTAKATQEEARTVGISNTKTGDTTENDIRSEHNLNPRIVY